MHQSGVSTQLLTAIAVRHYKRYALVMLALTPSGLVLPAFGIAFALLALVYLCLAKSYERWPLNLLEPVEPWWLDVGNALTGMKLFGAPGRLGALVQTIVFFAGWSAFLLAGVGILHLLLIAYVLVDRVVQLL